MKKNVLFLSGLLICLFLFFGCSSKTSDEEDEEVSTNSEVTEEAEPEKEEKPVEETEDLEETEEVQEEDKNDINFGDYEAYIGGEMIESDDKIIINGESNLLPGSRVVGEVTVGKDEYYGDEYDYFADTTEVIEEDGTFYMEIAQHDLEEATNVAVKFHFDGQQDDGIIRHYGDRGQNLEGPYIHKHQGEAGGRGPQNIFKKAEVRTTFEASEEVAIRQFAEPEWYEIPDDIGDPRVWIEVEEINDDDEYFYIHGRSNLEEGSRMRASYYFDNVDQTYVNPDGSFDFKFDYEYREDEPLIIEFRPYDYQWNIIEEVYGAEGQNLVGDLVETNKYNNKQAIELEIVLESQEIEVPDNVELTVKGSEITMLVPDKVLFDFDKFDLKDSSKEILSEISDTLATSFNKKDLDIVIKGHTDNVGDKKYNLDLSEKRAEKVKSYLEKQLDSNEANFTTEGYGDQKPITSNDDEKGQAKNRRVEIVINLK